MTKLLFFAGAALWPPPLMAGQIRSLRILEHLSRTHEVHFVTSVDAGVSHVPDETWLTGGARPASVTTVSGPRRCELPGLLNDYPWGSIAGRFMLPFLPGRPPLFASRLTEGLEHAIAAARARHGDVPVWAFDLPVAEVASRCGFTRIIVDLDDIEGDLWQSALRRRPASLSRSLHALEAARVRRYERHIPRRFTVAVAKRDDIALFPPEYADRITLVANGCDAPAASYVRKPVRGRFLFVGSLGWGPNTDAIRSLLASIFPRIRQQIPEATLSIAGRAPLPDDLASLVGPGVEILASPPSLAEIYGAAEIALQPVRIGSGTRLKSIDAMAHELPIIATAFCVSGLGAETGTHYVNAESDDDFVREAVALFDNSQQRQALAVQGKALYYSSLTWEAALRNVDTMIARTLNEGVSAA